MIVYVFAGILTSAVSLPMINRKVKRNYWYGFRLPKTLSSDEIWYPANEFAGKLLFVAGVITTVAAIVLTPLGLIPKMGFEIYAWALLVVTLGSMLTATWLSFRYVQKL